MTIELYPIERAAIEAIIRQHSDVAAELTEQLGGAQVIARNNTGAGFYVDFRIADNAPLAPLDCVIGDPLADVAGLRYGMGFLLFVRQGRMQCLEGYSFEDHVPPLDFETALFRMTDRKML